MIKKISMSTPVKKIFLWLLFVAIISLGFCYGSFNAGCSSSEREALMKFKQDLIDPSNRLASWIAVGDCCRWSGVLCDNSTGHVLELHLRILSGDEFFASNDIGDYEAYRTSTAFGGKVNPSLLNLKHLRYLDLSNNNFGGIHIPKFLGSMLSLRYLNLSGAGFGRMIPHQLGNLSNLHYLNLNFHYYGGDAENLHWLSGLSSLEFLDLSFVNLSKASNWLEVMNTLLSLKELYLRYCDLPHIPPLLNVNFSSLSVLDFSYNFFGESLVPNWVFRLKTLNSLNLAGNNFQGPISSDLQNMTSLRKLDLSDNYFNSSTPNWLYGFSHLKFLDLGYNELQGKISSGIGNMTSLVNLDLSDNEFEGGIPRLFKNLCNLRSLELSGVKLSQNIGKIFEILVGCVSHRLELLSLYSCQLFGHLTSPISQFKNLAFLDLYNNLISGPIPMSLGELMSLTSLDISNNKLNGSLPVSFGGLTKLKFVDISSNSLEGDVFETHFANLTKLRAFDASRNQLRLSVSPDWIPPLQLERLHLGSWHIGPQIPNWVRSLKHLSDLDLSNSGISGTISIWFWNLSFKFRRLNLSHNQIHGEIPNVFEVAPSRSWIDLSSNQFRGPLPYISSNVTLLDLSHNSFSGSMSKFLCYKMHEEKQMVDLNLEGNLLSGEMPNCWMSWPNLQGIILSNNNLIGNIPESIGNISSLQSLHLHHNHLFGEIPLSLQNCTDLLTLDLSENELEGTIPTWIGERFSWMVIFSLRSNKFHGGIPKELCHLDSLQILDLANNSLLGTIPSCVSNFSAMSTKIQSEGQIIYSSSEVLEDMVVAMKGQMMEYNTILNFVRVVDLSNNHLFGEIPKEITSLHELQSLNLSQNHLTGRIPQDIGAMQFLESLDFSQNQLSGEIPQSMSSLTFLSHLNLSNNKLSGKIPLGTQLQGLDPSSFIGNQLCGRPLIKNCNVDGVIPSNENGRKIDGDGVEIDWFYVSMALGFVVGFWSVLGTLLFNKRWRYAYFRFLDNLGYKIWWCFM